MLYHSQLPESQIVCVFLSLSQIVVIDGEEYENPTTYGHSGCRAHRLGFAFIVQSAKRSR